MVDYTGPGREHIERLPILVSGHDVDKLLSVPKLCDGTAARMNLEIVETLEEKDGRNELLVCALTLRHRTLGLLEEFVYV